MITAIEQFRQAMSSAGIEPPDSLTDDGNLHRYAGPHDKATNKKNWYVLYEPDKNGLQAGAFGRWVGDSNGAVKWCNRDAAEFTEEEKKEYKKRQDDLRCKQAEDRKQAAAECSEKCKTLWASAQPASDDHPYLVRKQVKAFGLKQLGDQLLVPIMTLKGELKGLQFISPDGSKVFKTGTDYSGALHMIGKPVDNTLIITEGYATGASIHMATGHAVLVAFVAGNLKAVAEAARGKQPSWEIIIAADNDQWAKEYDEAGNVIAYHIVPCELNGGKRINTGRIKAEEAAKAVKASCVLPFFRDESTHPTDFNDLHTLEGLDAVRLQVEAAKPVTDGLSTTAETSGYQWPEPLPLPEGLPSVKTLEPALIPAPLRGWLMDIADRMQIPPDFSTTAAVVALGSIIGRGCGIHPKRHDDWLVIPNLWGAVIGRPSLMKTPAITEAQRHLVRLETEAREAYQEDSQRQEINQEFNKITQAVICEGVKKAVRDAVKSDNPDAIEAAKAKFANLDREVPATRRRYQTQDGTTEKIGELLNQNPRGLLVNRDELIGWFRSLDKAGREGDRAFYLEAWNGTRGYTYDRIGRGTLDIDALCVSIFGAITPGPLSDYVYQASRGGNGDDGLLQRFQVMVWPDVPRDWRNVDRFPDTIEKNRACEIFRALAGDIPGAVKEDGADLQALRFTPDGQEVFDTWRQALETRLRSDHGLPPSLESHLAKYRSLMPSLALIIHLVDVADGSTAAGPVSERAALMAVGWCQYLESHAGRVYGGATMPGMEAAREIIKHINRGAIQDGSKLRDIHRNQWTRLATPEEVKAGMEVLQEYDWLTVDKITTGGRPSEIVRLNPAIKV